MNQAMQKSLGVPLLTVKALIRAEVQRRRSQ